MTEPALDSTPKPAVSRYTSLAAGLIPLTFLLCLYYPSFRIWYRHDDFALLGFVRRIHDLRSFFEIMFAPYAQGTVRPLSERLPFFLSSVLFGNDGLAFRIAAFLTAAADVLLISHITLRATGSRIASLAAPCFWIAAGSLLSPMTWNSSYNEIQFPLLLLGGLALFIRYADTGRRILWWLQLLVFVLGFGSLENNVVYPALLLSWILFVEPASRRKRLLSATLPLFAVSAIYLVIHFLQAPLPRGGVYETRLDWRVSRTFGEYFSWAFVTPLWYRDRPAQLGTALDILMMFSLLAFTLWQVRRGFTPVLFFASWFLLNISPFLLLPNRHSEYYLCVPVIGFAMLAGWAVHVAWHGGTLWRAVALVPVAAYFAAMLPPVVQSERGYVKDSTLSRNLVLGMVAARAAHPDKTLLIDGVTPDMYHVAIFDSGFHAARVQNVYMTPDAESLLPPEALENYAWDGILDRAVVLHSLSQGNVVVYEFAADHLRNTTPDYKMLASYRYAGAGPLHIQAGDPLYSYLFGAGWATPEAGVRYMPAAAAVHIATPDQPGSRLFLSGYCDINTLRREALRLEVSADGVPLGETIIREPETHFKRWFTIPPQVLGRQDVTVSLHLSGNSGIYFGTIAAEPPPLK